MITADNIKTAARQYIDSTNPYGITDTRVDTLPFFTKKDIEKTFEAGIGWYKNHLWHSIRERPNEGKVLCQDINNEFLLVEADADWKQKIYIYDIWEWCYLRDLVL